VKIHEIWMPLSWTKSPCLATHHDCIKNQLNFTAHGVSFMGNTKNTHTHIYEREGTKKKNDEDLQSGKTRNGNKNHIFTGAWRLRRTSHLSTRRAEDVESESEDGDEDEDGVGDGVGVWADVGVWAVTGPKRST